MVNDNETNAPPPSKAARNEQIKVNATFLNNLGVALIVGGFFVPYIGVVERLGSASSIAYLLSHREGQLYLVMFMASAAVGLVLHVAVAKLVERLED